MNGPLSGIRQELSGWRWTTAALLAALCGPAGAASIDLGRIFDVGRDLRTATTSLDEPEEIAVGREVAGRTLGAAPLVADPELQAYVNRVGRWIAMQTERPDLPWHFGVLDTASVNAFAAPGGYVLVTRGLYEMLDSESQLAGVLGGGVAVNRGGAWGRGDGDARAAEGVAVALELQGERQDGAAVEADGPFRLEDRGLGLARAGG